MNLAQRKDLEAAYKRSTGKDPPPLNKQGSQKFIDKMWESFQQNQVGYVDLKHIVAAVPSSRDIVRTSRRSEMYTSATRAG